MCCHCMFEIYLPLNSGAYYQPPAVHERIHLTIFMEICKFSFIFPHFCSPTSCCYSTMLHNKLTKHIYSFTTSILASLSTSMRYSLYIYIYISVHSDKQSVLFSTTIVCRKIVVQSLRTENYGLANILSITYKISSATFLM